LSTSPADYGYGFFDDGEGDDDSFDSRKLSLSLLQQHQLVSADSLRSSSSISSASLSSISPPHRCSTSSAIPSPGCDTPRTQSARTSNDADDGGTPSPATATTTAAAININYHHHNNPNVDIHAAANAVAAGEDTEKTVVFVFQNSRAPQAIRSFENMYTAKLTQVCVSIEGFRIVQDEAGEQSEFKFQMLVDGREITAWKTYADFEELATACREFSSVEVTSTSWTSLFRPSPPLKLLRHSDASIDLTESLLAWEKVLEDRFWAWLGGALSVQRLMEEMANLDRFIQNLLFESPSPELLLEFLSTTP
jgi:hypothetical protein